MLRSSNDMTSGQRFAVKVTKREDGMFEASAKDTNVKIPPIAAKTEQLAISYMNDRLAKLVAEGYDEEKVK